VAGLRLRLGEEENRRIEAQNSISHAEENSPSDLSTVASDSNDAHYLKEEEGRLAEQSARAKLRLKSQLILEQSRERIETKLAGKSVEEPPGIVREIPEEHLHTAQLSASTESGTVTDLTITPEPPPRATESSPTGTLKRCPNCNAMYNSELLAYCALDATPLVDAESVPVATVASQPPEVSNRNMLWVLVGVVLIGSASMTLLITSFFATAEPVSTPVVETAAPAPPPPESNKPVVGGDLAGMELDVPLPNYPQNARDQGIKGDVTVRVRVNSRGRVISVRGSRGEGQLVRSALAAARKATFSPEKLSSKTVRGTITYSFK
jgi:TonB family protein